MLNTIKLNIGKETITATLTITSDGGYKCLFGGN